MEGDRQIMLSSAYKVKNKPAQNTYNELSARQLLADPDLSKPIVINNYFSALPSETHIFGFK